MSPYQAGGAPELLHMLLRRRREELDLMQAELAEKLHVTPESVGQWECGRRRMELGKLPRIAAVLQMDPKELCARALAEFYPAVYDALFGKAVAGPDSQARAPEIAGLQVRLMPLLAEDIDWNGP